MQLSPSSVSDQNGLENNFFTRNGKAHIMIKPELFFCLLKQSLKLGTTQDRDGHNVSASVFTDIYNKVTLWDVQRKAFLVMIPLFLSQA